MRKLAGPVRIHQEESDSLIEILEKKVALHSELICKQQLALEKCVSTLEKLAMIVTADPIPAQNPKRKKLLH